jgi:integrase
LHSKKVAGYVEDSIYEAAFTLRHFERIIGKCNSKQITQSAIDKYILERGKEGIRSTLNKDIRNLKAFVRWCRKNRYVNGEIEISELKEDEKPVKSLSNTQIKKVISASKRHKTLRMRILLTLGTGLRLGDIDSIMISDIDFEKSSVTTRSRKTRKSMGLRLVPVPIMAELKKYVSGLDVNQEKIFNNYFSRYAWTKIRRKLGLEGCTFHDLRKTFCSILAQNGYPQLSRKSCWNIPLQNLPTKYILMLILYCVMLWIKYLQVTGYNYQFIDNFLPTSTYQYASPNTELICISPELRQIFNFNNAILIPV